MQHIFHTNSYPFHVQYGTGLVVEVHGNGKTVKCLFPRVRKYIIVRVKDLQMAKDKNDPVGKGAFAKEHEAFWASPEGLRIVGLTKAAGVRRTALADEKAFSREKPPLSCRVR